VTAPPTASSFSGPPGSYFEQASAAGDADAAAALFAEDGAYLPLTGGAFVGSDAIRAGFRTQRPGSLDVVSTSVTEIGNVVFDQGTFAIKLPPEAGGMTIPGEYVAVMGEAEGSLKLHRLVIFSTRRPPGS
jgi:ketosteroid isomerase-like protein